MRGPVRSFSDLEVWQRGVRLACEVVRVSRAIPKVEQYALASQLRKAAVSVPSNVAEGWGRGSNKEFLRYLAISRGSLFELHTQLVIAREVAYLDAAAVGPLLREADELSRMLLALSRSLVRHRS